MAKFLLLILIVLFAIIGLVGFSILKFVRSFTNPNQNRSAAGNSRHEDRQDQHRYNDNHQKVFSKDEGEYIDYEEVK